MQEDADSLTQFNKSNPIFVQTFKILGLIVPEKSYLTFDKQMEKGKKMEKEGKINHSILLFFYTLGFNPL